MATSRQIIDVVYSVLANSNLSRVLPVLDEQIAVSLPGYMPSGGEYHGRSGFLTMMSSMYKLWETTTISSLRYFTPDDSLPQESIVTIGTFEGKLHTVNEPIRLSFIHYWQLKSDKVISLRAFFWDTATLLAHLQSEQKKGNSSSNGHHTSDSGNVVE